ncbi:cold-regulated 413 plasma membrane protein 2-like isoform X2 [Castanea sativa]|uniref:cold-regulated 413 plasma membrane protein 2-like isoform X2 n=1 Tax=Castanea sativa TaxID=21020 RepID=UPI003F64C768
MAKTGYIRMKTDQDLLNSDVKDLANAVKKIATHVIKLGSLGFGTTFLEWLAAFAAIYLLILDRTNWKTNILTSLLIPYIFLSLPSLLFSILRGEIGRWIAFIAVVLRLFFPKHFPGKHSFAITTSMISAIQPNNHNQPNIFHHRFTDYDCNCRVAGTSRGFHSSDGGSP